MATTRSIKIDFKGDSRDVDIPLPATLAGLQAAIALTFGIELPARSAGAGADSDLSFTYRDPDGDDIVFDIDSELSLALRLCPTLEISATRKVEPKNPTKLDEENTMYKVAAHHLRAFHGVPSMTPVKLIKILTLFKLSPRCLIQQGLAPARLLTDKSAPVPLGGGDNEDLAEVMAANMELMSGDDDEKEWNDGFMSVGNENTVNGDDSSKKAEDHDDSNKPDGNSKKSKNVIHAALLAADIKLHPSETVPLLRALGVHPGRLVKLGLVDGKELRALLSGCAPWTITRPVVCGPGARGARGARGPVGKVCGPMHRHGPPVSVLLYRGGGGGRGCGRRQPVGYWG